MAKKCSKCSALADDDAVFCSKCGNQSFDAVENNDEKVVELDLGHIGDEKDNGVGFDTPEKEHSVTTEEEVVSQVSTQQSAQNNNVQASEIKPVQNNNAQASEIKPVQNNVTNESKEITPSANPAPNPNFEVRNPQYDGTSQPVSGVTVIKKKKKKDNHKVIMTICGIVGVILLVLSLTLFLLIFLAGDDDSQYNPASTFTEKNSISIGNEVNGYIRVPNSWKKVEAGVQGNEIVYTDDLEKGSWYIVSGVADSGVTNPQDWANSTYTALVSQGVMEAGINREVVNNYETYKVVCFKPAINKYLASWYFNTSDGRTHYISIEGPDAINDFYNMIYTYREKN